MKKLLLANGVGMQTRFDAVEPQVAKWRTADERVDFSQDNFSMLS